MSDTVGARLKIITQNYGLDGAWTATNAVSSLPPVNLSNESRQRVWRALGTSASIIVDLQAALSVEGLALVSANLTVSASITVDYSVDAAFSSPGTLALTPWDASDSGVLVWFMGGPLVYRYWRFNLNDPGNPAGFVQVGVPVLGPVIDFGDVSAKGAKGPGLGVRHQDIDPSLIGRSPSGTPKSLVLPQRTRLTMPTNVMTTAWAFGTLRRHMRDAGTATDMVLSMYSTAPGHDATARAQNLYGRVTDLPELAYDPAPWWSGQLVFEESR